jgi:hypothetical protein
MINNHVSYRRGATLAELMVAMAFASVVMLGVTKLLLMLSTTERTTRQRHESALVLDRLLAQFQEDVHAAVRRLDEGKPRADANAPALARLQLPTGQVVEYRNTAGVVERIVRHEAQVIAREVYRLPEFAQVEIRSEETNPPWLTLAVTPSASPDRLAGIEALQVRAALSRDSRFATSGAKTP